MNVLITGASTGIGLELARIFARNGHKLILVSRSKEKLLAAAKTIDSKDAKIIVSDLTREHAAEVIFNELTRRSIEVDCLVNNAGFGTYGAFFDSDVEEQISMIQLNATALTHLTRLLLPGMINRKSGKIMNVASTAAFQPGPTMAVYFATKAYVLSFSQALSSELEGTGVSVTCLCPGPTETEFQKRAGMDPERIKKSYGMMVSLEVAEKGYKGMMEGKRVVIPGFKNNLFANSVRFLPTSIVLKFLKRGQKKLK